LYQGPPSVIMYFGHFPYASTRCSKKALVLPSSLTKKDQGKPHFGVRDPGLHRSRPLYPHLHPSLVHHNHRWEETSVEFDPLLSHLPVPIPHRHMAHSLPPKAQDLRCLPETQAQLIKHKPQSYLPEGDAVFSHNPLCPEEVSRFSGTQPGFSFHGPSP